MALLFRYEPDGWMQLFFYWIYNHDNIYFFAFSRDTFFFFHNVTRSDFDRISDSHLDPAVKTSAPTLDKQETMNYLISHCLLHPNLRPREVAGLGFDLRIKLTAMILTYSNIIGLNNSVN